MKLWDIWLEAWKYLEGEARECFAKPPGADRWAVGVARPIEGTLYDRDAEETQRRAAIVAFARSRLNDLYRFGAEVDPAGPPGHVWDCSELTENAYCRAGLAYPDGANYQRAHSRGRRVRDPKAGDPFFFDPDGNGIGHTGLYAGDGTVLEARSHHTNGLQDGRVRITPRWEIERHARFAGWFRHPDFAYPIAERV